jgi:hypothetical protein
VAKLIGKRIVSKEKASTRASAASTLCAEKPRKRVFPAARAATNASSAPDGTEYLRHVFFLRHRMKLIQVHVIRAQVPQRRLELGGRASARSLQRLARKKDVLSIRLERRPEHLLGIPVAGRDVEVVHAAIDGVRDALGRLRRARVHDDDAAEADDGELLAGAAEGAALERASRGSFGCRQRRRKAAQHRTGRGVLQERAALDLHVTLPSGPRLR